MPLTREQRELVSDNIGLVSVHLKRYVRNLGLPHRDREWDDLFQEGCIGLMTAASRYRKSSGIPFAAFALPRIHHAVSRALLSKFATVYVPPRRDRATTKTGEDMTRPRPRCVSMGDREESEAADRPARSVEEGDEETIAQRLGAKYERALRHAVATLATTASRRGDRGELLHMLTEQRLLVPDEDTRASLRGLACQTRSSYARVAQCEQQLKGAIKATLERDPEFAAMRRLARHHPDGSDLIVDAPIERQLRAVAAERMAERFAGADSDERAHILLMVVQAAGLDARRLVRTGVERLGPLEREELLHETTCRDGTA